MKHSQGMYAALRHRDFRRLIESAVVSQIGDWLPRTASVTAASDCVLDAIDAETFKSALETDAMVASQAFESATSRLSMLNN